jgi:hypothetical protein
VTDKTLFVSRQPKRTINEENRMKYFGEYRDETIHSFIHLTRERAASLLRQPAIATLENTTTSRVLALATERGVSLSENDIKDQFIVFQFSQKVDGPTILDTSEVEPAKSGSAEKPDALAVVQLASFSVGTDEGIGKNTRATLRLDLGKDSNSNSHLDTVFWSIAAGLNLYDNIKNKRSEAKDLKTDFNEAFSKRPVEIPGGLGKLSFEVIKHIEPKWWQRIFTFLQSGTGKALTAAVGFPAITGQAIGFLDELLNRLDKSNPEILFKCRPMTLALTKRARDSFNAGVPSVSVGVMNPGFCLLARGRDYKTLVDNKPVFMGAYGLLKPKDMPLEEFLQSPSNNPFNKMTYAVLKVGTAETKLNPALDYGG